MRQPFWIRRRRKFVQNCNNPSGGVGASPPWQVRWNSFTLGINGVWYEVDREEHAQPPRPYVYVLRPTPPGKIVRGYQEYHAATPETVGIEMPDADLT